MNKLLSPVYLSTIQPKSNSLRPYIFPYAFPPFSHCMRSGQPGGHITPATARKLSPCTKTTASLQQWANRVTTAMGIAWYYSNGHKLWLQQWAPEQESDAAMPGWPACSVCSGFEHNSVHNCFIHLGVTLTNPPGRGPLDLVAFLCCIDADGSRTAAAVLRQ